MERLTQHYVRLLEGLVANPEKKNQRVGVVEHAGMGRAGELE